ncbi:hypothetical protein A3H75_01360 [Candidatus Uhrbacteria bacterium RIFCSPLOWO2_02_FULL_51_9]|uniref:Uncharacterized protein n=1 Tax=Candidatus Uhrbacteria bacterium RIFCSPLOWO2_02_FULL_51_9 TaxID=1802410 RepID=A0A1F7VFZ4_9BACT|nr:MAG: hypothetical protein A3H75_01360 [Candidatus Uhrbacteria bacterium RIFCSPLOWO2_02_FULL_51_9]
MFDGGGQDIGILLDESYRTLLVELNLIVSFDAREPPSIYLTRGIFFDRANCIGNAYLNQAYVTNHSYALQEIHGGTPNVFGYYRVVPGSQPVDVVTVSRPNGSRPGNCLNFQEELFAYPLEPIVLPFHEPLAWPLKIGLVQ